MSDAVRHSARSLGAVVGIGLASSVALGLALGVAQGESVLRWIAYMLYLAGSVVLGFAFLTGAPASPRKLAKERVLKKDQQPRDPAEKPFASELVVLATAGVALFCAGFGLEFLL